MKIDTKIKAVTTIRDDEGDVLFIISTNDNGTLDICDVPAEVDMRLSLDEAVVVRNALDAMIRQLSPPPPFVTPFRDPIHRG
jgi:hypothetical protein